MRPTVAPCGASCTPTYAVWAFSDTVITALMLLRCATRCVGIRILARCCTFNVLHSASPGVYFVVYGALHLTSDATCCRKSRCVAPVFSRNVLLPIVVRCTYVVAVLLLIVVRCTYVVVVGITWTNELVRCT